MADTHALALDAMRAKGAADAATLAAKAVAGEANAQELLDDLTIQSNHMRQGAITQELTEISAGALGQRRRQERQTEGGNML